MIQTIGMQKVILLAILAALAIGGYFYNTNILGPDMTKSERQLRVAKSNLQKRTADTDRIINGVNIFSEQKEEFMVIQKSGFFDDQNRVTTQKRLEEMQLDSNLKTFLYNVSPAEIISNRTLKDAGYQLLKTVLEFDLGAIDDTDVNNFLYLLNHGFPGLVLISSVDMEKKQSLTQPILRNIGLDASFQPLVEAKIVAEWYTMVPESDESNTEVRGQ